MQYAEVAFGSMFWTVIDLPAPVIPNEEENYSHSMN